MNAQPCTHCNHAGTANPRVYPGPVRKWWYAPWDADPEKNGFAEVHLHACCVGPFMVLNAPQDIVVRIAEMPT